MSKTIQQSVIDLQTLTGDSSTSSGTLAKTLINFGIRSVLGSQDWTFYKGSETRSSATSVQDYSKPYNAFRMDYVNYWDSGVWYALPEVKDSKQWRIMNSTVVTGLPYCWHISNRTGNIGLFPIPAGSSGTIKMGFLKKIRDLGASDYSTGSVSATAGSNILSSGSSSWGTVFQGRSLSISGTNTIVDGYWFEIDEIIGTGTLTVKEEIPVGVTTASYKISELIPIPDGYEDIVLWYALDRYYQMKEKPALAREYERKYKEQLGELMNRDMRSVSGLIEQEDSYRGSMNANSNPWSITLS